MTTVLHYIRDTHGFEVKGQGVCNILFLKRVQKKVTICVCVNR